MDFSIKTSLEEVSLFDFGKGLIAILISSDFKVPTENRGWHEFFYKLKEEERDGKPEFFNDLRFDWDLPYPKSPELSDLFQALNLADLARPLRGRIVVDEHIISHWLQQVEIGSPKLKHYFDYASKRARKYLVH